MYIAVVVEVYIIMSYNIHIYLGLYSFYTEYNIINHITYSNEMDKNFAGIFSTVLST